ERPQRRGRVGGIHHRGSRQEDLVAMTLPQTGPSAETQTKAQVTPTFVDFLCYRIDPASRPRERSRAVADEFRNLLENPGAGLEVRPYLTAGYRSDCDFFLW